MYRYILLITTGCFFSLSLLAQRDTTKQSINITSSFKPVLRNAVKINFSGSQLLADTTASVRPYVIPAQNLFYAYQPISLKPLALQQDTNLYLGNRNYIKAGFGNFSTPYVKAGLSFGNGKTALVNLYGMYISSKGKIKNQDYMEFEGKATASYFTKKFEVYGSGSVSQHDYFLYGYDHALYDYKKADIKQHLQDITIKAGIRNTNVTEYRINYNPNVEFNIFSNYNKLNETTVIVNAPVEKKFGDNFAVKVEAKGDFTNYYTKGLIPNNYNFSNNVIQVSPSLVYSSPKFSINGGLTPTWNNSKFVWLPNVFAEFQLQQNVFMFQAGWVGRYIKNTYRNLSAMNPYLSTITSQTNTKEVEFYGGIKGSLGKHFNFNAKAGLVTYNDLPFFINDTSAAAGDSKAFVIANESKVNNFRVHGDLSYINQEKFTVNAGVTFNGYTGMKSNAKAWNTVPVEINGSLRWWAFRQVLLKADYYMFGGGNYIEKGDVRKSFKPGSDLSAGVEFKINKQFSAWLDVNNILNNKYERWHNYQVYGLNLLGGIRFDF
ncbi:MAG: hypothetical protein ABI741_14770 [Ferruginibacter sp.]